MIKSLSIIESHNLFREMENLPLLKESDSLTIIAQKHAKWMARRYWLNNYGLIFANNIAIGDTIDNIIRQIINQPETRTIMFGDYTYIGSGSFRSRKNLNYWCILYT